MIFVSRHHWLKSVLFFFIEVVLDSVWGLMFMAVGIALAAVKMRVQVGDILADSEGASLLGLAVFVVLLLRVAGSLFQRLITRNESD